MMRLGPPPRGPRRLGADSQILLKFDDGTPKGPRTAPSPFRPDRQILKKIEVEGALNRGWAALLRAPSQLTAED